MKKITLVAVTVLLVSSFAFAHGNKLAMSAESISVVAEKFEKEEAPSLPDVIGVKGWPDADKIQVRVYLTNNRTVSYTCHMMNNQIMCAKVP